MNALKVMTNQAVVGKPSRAGVGSLARWARCVLFGLLTLCFAAHASYAQGEALQPVPFAQLSDKAISSRGQQALAMGPERWKHAETEHFVIHYMSPAIAAPVAREVEFYFRYLLRELTGTTEGIKKGHLFVFEDKAEWRTFCAQVSLEGWVGAFTNGNELFVVREPSFQYKSHALGHEVVHYMCRKFLSGRPPLWFEEGYAEDASMRAYTAMQKAQNFRVAYPDGGFPNSFTIAELGSFRTYPSADKIDIFYSQSRQIVRYLSGFGNKEAFLQLLRTLAAGRDFESALTESYGSKWTSLEAFEEAFHKQSKRPGPSE